MAFVTLGAGVSKVTALLGSWDTGSEFGTKAVLMHPFKPLVCIADDNETIRYCFTLESQITLYLFAVWRVQLTLEFFVVWKVN